MDEFDDGTPAPEAREDLRDACARRIMGWETAVIPWAYDQAATVWLSAAGEPIMTRHAWRPDENDGQCLQVLDREEMRFTFTGESPFEGLEDEGRVRVDPRSLRAGYLEALETHIQAIERAAKGFGFDHHVVDSHESVGPALTCLLDHRNAWIARSKVG